MVRYRSKIGWIIVLVIGVLLVSSMRLMMEGIGIGSIIFLLIFIFVIYTLLSTYYEIGGGTLRIKSGFLLNRSIPINAITKIEATNNPISAPATSLDRLEIFYNKYESVIISPKEKLVFIAHLKQINPAIQDNSAA